MWGSNTYISNLDAEELCIGCKQIWVAFYHQYILLNHLGTLIFSLQGLRNDFADRKVSHNKACRRIGSGFVFAVCLPLLILRFRRN